MATKSGEDFIGDTLERDGGERNHRSSYRGGPVESVCGWNVFVSGLHPAVTEDDVNDAFSDISGGRMNLARVNYDRITGECKGYGLVEYETKAAGQDAINRLHGKAIKGQKIGVHWAFVKPLQATTGSKQGSN